MPILDFSRGGWDERMDVTHLSVFLSVLNRASERARETVSLPRFCMLSTLFLVWSKTLYDIHVT